MAILASVPAAWGHASLVDSDPIDRAVVAQSPTTIKLNFNEPVSPLVLRLVGPDGQSTDLKDVTAADQALTIAVPAPLPRGTHLLSWRVISADGHPVGGAITFSVIEPSAEPPMRPQFETDRKLQAAIWLGKIAVYFGLLFGVGGVFYAAWIADAPLPEAARMYVSAALQCGLIAAVISIGLQGVDVMNLPPSEIRQTQLWVKGFETSYGLSASIAIAVFILALSTLHMKTPGRLQAALSLAGVGAALAVSGHAASAAPQFLTRSAVFLHGVSVAFWVGAFIPLVATMGTAEQRIAELARFSRAIPTAVAVLVVSGLALSVVQLVTVDALWTTSYGLVLSGKLVAVLALLTLGAWNRYALTPRIVGGDRISAKQLSASIKFEFAIVVAILGLVALWRFTPPPRTYQALAASPVQVHIHTASAMADVRFEPVRAGGQTVTIALWDGNFAPLPAKEVTLVLAKPDTGIEPLRASASYVADSSWRIESLTVPMTGHWRIRVEILISDFEKLVLQDEVEFLR